MRPDGTDACPPRPDADALRRIEAALAIRTDLYAMLARTNRAMNRCASPEELYRELCAIAVETGRFRFAWVGVPADEVLAPVASAGEDQGYMKQLVISLDELDPRSQGPTGRAARLGQPVVVNDFQASELTAPWHEKARRVGFGASAAFPLLQGGRVVAVLTLYAAEAGFFTEELLQTLREITPSVSFALDHLAQERERQRSLEMLRAVTDGTSDAVYIKDRAGRYLLCNPATARFLGRPAEDVLGRDDTALFAPDDARFIMDWDRRIVERGQVETAEEQLGVVGARRTFLTTKAPYRDAAGRIAGVIGIARDVTDRKLDEAALHLRDRAIQAVAQGILIVDATHPDRPIIFASPGFSRLTGYAVEEVMGRNCRFLQGRDTDPAAVAAVREAVRAGRAVTVELLNYRKDGTPFWNSLAISPVLDANGRLTHFVGVQSDVTERKRLEERVRQSQKMEAIGLLAGGVAHDFNNLLTVINGYSDPNALPQEMDPALREAMREIHRAGERAGHLTRQLLAFSRQQVLEPKLFCPNAVVV